MTFIKKYALVVIGCGWIAASHALAATSQSPMLVLMKPDGSPITNVFYDLSCCNTNNGWGQTDYAQYSTNAWPIIFPTNIALRSWRTGTAELQLIPTLKSPYYGKYLIKMADIRKADKPFELVAHKCVVLSGRVVAPNGEFAPNGTVCLNGEEGYNETTRISESGEFRFNLVCATNQVSLSAYSLMHDKGRSKVHLHVSTNGVDVAKSSTIVTLIGELEELYTVVARLITKENEQTEWHPVRFSGNAGFAYNGGGIGVRFTNGTDGASVPMGLPTAKYRLNYDVRVNDKQLLTREFVIPDDLGTNGELILLVGTPQPMPVEVRVLDKKTRQGIANARLVVQEENVARTELRAGKDGKAELRLLHSACRVSVTADGYFAGYAEVQTGRTNEVLLEKGRKITGKVARQDHTPVTNVLVSALLSASSQKNACTDATGAYCITFASGKEARIMVVSTNFSLEIKRIELSEQGGQCDFVLSDGYPVILKVPDTVAKELGNIDHGGSLVVIDQKTQLFAGMHRLTQGEIREPPFLLKAGDYDVYWCGNEKAFQLCKVHIDSAGTVECPVSDLKSCRAISSDSLLQMIQGSQFSP